MNKLFRTFCMVLFTFHGNLNGQCIERLVWNSDTVCIAPNGEFSCMKDYFLCSVVDQFKYRPGQVTLLAYHLPVNPGIRYMLRISNMHLSDSSILKIEIKNGDTLKYEKCVDCIARIDSLQWLQQGAYHTDYGKNMGCVGGVYLFFLMYPDKIIQCMSSDRSAWDMFNFYADRMVVSK